MQKENREPEAVHAMANGQDPARGGRGAGCRGVEAAWIQRADRPQLACGLDIRSGAALAVAAVVRSVPAVRHRGLAYPSPWRVCHDGQGQQDAEKFSLGAFGLPAWMPVAGAEVVSLYQVNVGGPALLSGECAGWPVVLSR